MPLPADLVATGTPKLKQDEESVKTLWTNNHNFIKKRPATS